jgi:UDP-glucose 4-epimerase
MISSNTKMIAPRLGEAYITLANNEKIKTVLGWEPTKRIEDYVEEKLKELDVSC